MHDPVHCLSLTTAAHSELMVTYACTTVVGMVALRICLLRSCLDPLVSAWR